MRVLNILFFIVLIFILAGCREKEQTGNIELVFKATYNDQPLVMYTNQPTGLQNPTAIQLSRLEFFLSDVIPSKDDGLSQSTFVNYVNLSSTTTLSSANEGVIIPIGKRQVGTYNKIEMSFGLSDEVNATTPSDYSSDSPLGVNANYWAGWNSYILSKIEGTITTTAGGNPPGFLYHSGVDGMLQKKVFNKSFEVIGGETTQIIFEINVEDLFFKTGSEIDVINNNSTHSGQVGSDAYNLAKLSIMNLANATEIK